MASSVPSIVDRLLSVVAVAITTLAVVVVVADIADGPELPEIPEAHRPSVIGDWETVFRSPDESYSVRIAVFSDYMCAYCADAAHTLRTLVEEHADVLIEYRSLPTRGDLSMRAATVAECARGDGRFEEMHHRLFSFADSLGIVPWARVEADAGIRDSVTFRTCLDQSSVPERIIQDLAVAERLGVTATPSILVDSLLFRGSPGLTYLDAYVRRVRLHNKRAQTDRG